MTEHKRIPEHEINANIQALAIAIERAESYWPGEYRTAHSKRLRTQRGATMHTGWHDDDLDAILSQYNEMQSRIRDLIAQLTLADHYKGAHLGLSERSLRPASYTRCRAFFLSIANQSC